MNAGLKIVAFVCGAILLGIAVGCSHPSDVETKVSTPQTAEDKIKMIESNTTLTAQQKQQQIARIQAGQ